MELKMKLINVTEHVCCSMTADNQIIEHRKTLLEENKSLFLKGNNKVQ